MHQALRGIDESGGQGGVPGWPGPARGGRGCGEGRGFQSLGPGNGEPPPGSARPGAQGRLGPVRGRVARVSTGLAGRPPRPPRTTSLPPKTTGCSCNPSARPPRPRPGLHPATPCNPSPRKLPQSQQPHVPPPCPAQLWPPGRAPVAPTLVSSPPPALVSSRPVPASRVPLQKPLAKRSAWGELPRVLAPSNWPSFLLEP